MKRTVVVLAVVVGCEAEPKHWGKVGEPPRVKPEPAPALVQPNPQPAPQPPAPTPPPPAPPTKPGVQTFDVDGDPTNLIVVGDMLMWTDTMGALWSMPAKGGDAKQLSHQHLPDRPMIGLLAAHRGKVYGTMLEDVVEIAGPDGPVKRLELELGGDPTVYLASDGEALYGTLMDSNAIYRLAPDGTRSDVMKLKKAILSSRGKVVYAMGYSSGELVTIENGKKARTIVRGLGRPTGLAVDDTHAYVWGEKDRAIRKIELKTGKQTVLARDGLTNSDVLVEDGAWVYTYSWLGPGKSHVVRVAKDGSKTQVIADDLSAPHDIAVDADAIYIANRDGGTIVRFEKRALDTL